MADVAQNIYVGKDIHNEGRIVNVYDTYAHALSHGATGLSTIYDMTLADGTEGSAISQAAETVGLTPDQNGFIHFWVAETTPIFLISNGMFGPPRRVVPA